MDTSTAQKRQPPQWWLISNETVEEIIRLLETLPEAVAKEALHALETGLHVSHVAPADFAEHDPK